MAGYLFVAPPIPQALARVTVTELGAVGDGISDSSAAFRNATEQASHGGQIVSTQYTPQAYSLFRDLSQIACVWYY